MPCEFLQNEVCHATGIDPKLRLVPIGELRHSGVVEVLYTTRHDASCVNPGKVADCPHFQNVRDDKLRKGFIGKLQRLVIQLFPSVSGETTLSQVSPLQPTSID